MPLGPGTAVKDNIVLDEPLGSGGMGEVWRATNRALGAPVAVKVLHLHHANNQEALARFSQEARAVAKLDSPHVVKIYDYGITDEGEPFIVMELLRGMDLGQRIERHGALSIAETVKVVQQLCTALAQAHQMGLVHRDIKPANIFLADTGTGDIFVKVLDFGVAKHTEADMGMTSTQAVMGTPYYMSPEQFVTAKGIDHRADLWSVAVVVYACLVGKLPFSGETVGALSLAVHKCAFTPPSSLRSDLPPSIDAWFTRAMQVDREHRFQSAYELAEAFEAAARGVAQAATHAPAPHPGVGHAPQVGQPAPAQKSSKGPWIVAVLVLALLAGAGALFGPRLLAQKKGKKKDDVTARASDDEDGESSAAASASASTATSADTSESASAEPRAAGLAPTRGKALPAASASTSAKEPSTIPDTSGFASKIIACWKQHAGIHAKNGGTGTVSFVMKGGAPQQILVSGITHGTTKACIIGAAQAHYKSFGSREADKTVVASAQLPPCEWDKGKRQWMCR